MPVTTFGPDLVDSMRGERDAMVAALQALVEAESPSGDLEATATCATTVAALGAGRLGEGPERIEVEGRTHLLWRFGTPRVVVIGHFDTVWPVGTLDRWPFSVEEDRATGPGVFDMKAGVVQAIFALGSLEHREGACLLLTSDEELGSPTSRALIEETVAGVSAALVCEPSAIGGALKTGRKGVSMYTVHVHGRAAHGSDPARGANASLEVARLMLEVESWSDPAAGTTVTPTLVAGGTTQNTIPEHAWFYTDVRVASPEEAERIDGAMRGLTARDPGCRVVVTGGANRPPFTEAASAGLFERAARLSEGLGLPPARALSVPGGSDGNFTAGLGIPTLDGLGAVGDLAHAEGEYVSVGPMAERSALLAALVGDLLAG